MFLYYFIKILTAMLFMLFYSFKVIYEDRIPDEPCIFVANHQSLLDPIAVVDALNRKVIFLASEDLYKIPILNYILITTGNIPIKKKSADINAIKRALNVLNKGYSIALFPEGGISPNGELKEGYKGAMYLSYKSGRPIVPIGINGTYDIMPLGKYKLGEGKISVKIGSAIYPDMSLPKNESIETLKDKVMHKVKKLIEA
ncbi:lysophospholipid acyltransferase family protein [Thermoanaerobacterium sp. RBIITD]|uniref:lysophospholipid acyltransferase family protein n=1 Tax=Thermoanaerobacterium sp. RBIITD TaxID=1550240 RepID=UPI000BB9799E|nr:lysophospholipid acyltransferase family protein [Thermoanaerobacterium sp. RBIITD]SNX54432.1 1-acyl-sn-glycerol-3-phosphate acyltransferase [Thermoanaerobacterium sp. RBIITD]